MINAIVRRFRVWYFQIALHFLYLEFLGGDLAPGEYWERLQNFEGEIRNIENPVKHD